MVFYEWILEASAITQEDSLINSSLMSRTDKKSSVT